MKTKKSNRLLALLLCLGMLLTMLPLSGMAFAAEQGCNHVHDEACGYVATMEGQLCTFQHEHDEFCGWAEAVEASPCSAEANHTHDESCGGDPDTGEGCVFHHEHDDTCGWAEAKEASPCSVEAEHIHDDTCSYSEAVEGQPCNHVHNDACGGLALGSLEQSAPQVLPQDRAGGADTIPAMNPGAVGFAGAEWWVIGKDGAGINSADGTMTLMSKDNLIADGSFGPDNEYGDSELKSRMEAFYDGNALLPQEKGLILPRTLDGVRIGDSFDATLPGDHYVWPLSKAEAEILPNDVRTSNSASWLRSASNAPSMPDGYADAVNYSGPGVFDRGVLSNSWGGRPALTLNLGSVLFTSAAAGGKLAAGSGLQAYAEPTGTVKLTVKDDVNLALNVTTTGPIMAEVGGTASFSYTGAKTGAGRSVSVLIKDKTSGANLYYGRPVDCASGNTSGAASFQLPDGLTAGEYTLLAFNEQVNGDNLTDFASTAKELILQVEKKSDPIEVPGVANGDTVYFAGNEWFIIGLNGAGVNPQNDTMTLLSKDNLIAAGKFGKYNIYGSSDLKDRMEAYYNGLSAAEKVLILPRTLNNVVINNDFNGTLLGNHYVWPLSRVEAESLPQDTIRANNFDWWLRSLSFEYDYNHVDVVTFNGATNKRVADVSESNGARPALTIDLSSAIFASVSAGKGGSISPSGNVVVPEGGSQTFSLKANRGYKIDQVLVDGMPVAFTGDSYTLTGADKNCTIKANFILEAEPVTLPGLALHGNVGYAGEEWYVIGLNEENGSVNPGIDTMTLLSKDNLIANGVFGSDNQYGDSDLKIKMEAYYNGNTLLVQEKGLILPRTLNSVRIGNNNNAILNGDHFVWPLSKDEAESLPQNTILANGSAWWLRSPFTDEAHNGYRVGPDGLIKYLAVGNARGSRPALTLNLDSVLFTSAAAGGKPTAGNGLQAYTVPTGTAKLTVKDDVNLSLTVTTKDPIMAQAGGTVSFDYTGAKTGANRSVSVLIKDKTTDAILCYGRPVDCGSGNAAGTASFQLPEGLAAGDYTLLAFNEQVNGDNVTDLVSTPKELTLKVEPKSTPDVPGPATYSLTIQAGTGGKLVQGTSGSYAAGASIPIEASANTDYAFDSWTTSNGGTFVNANSASTTFTMPADATTITANFRYTGGGSDPDPGPATYSLTMQAETGGKIVQGTSGSYTEGETISIEAKADKNYVFDGWTASNGGAFVNASSADTIFTMPARDTIVTANFRYVGSDPEPGPSYRWRTLTDKASGVRVSGLFTDDAVLEVKEMLPHLQGDCDVCDDIRARQNKGELIALFDVALKSGKYKGELDVEIPVGEQYNGQTVIMIHCKDKVMDSRTLTVENGIAKGTFSGLSPYAVAKVPGKTAVTYTVDDVPHTATTTINSERIPQTGDTANTLTWVLLLLAALLGGGLLAYRRLGCTKRNG